MKIWAVVSPDGSVMAPSVQLTEEQAIIAFLVSNCTEKLAWDDCVAKGYACEEFVLTPTAPNSRARSNYVTAVAAS